MRAQLPSDRSSACCAAAIESKLPYAACSVPLAHGDNWGALAGRHCSCGGAGDGGDLLAVGFAHLHMRQQNTISVPSKQ